ncbi:pentapeptide repeat-containing protein [Planosporangium flavigriseum]|uniref:pentapeptide repeat-containing protein n=1 Tax=Planosporangium flavigriseum TaxID=373681 RepID=UPI0035714AA7
MRSRARDRSSSHTATPAADSSARGCVLTGCVLTGCVLTGCVLTGCVLRSVTGSSSRT